MLCFHAVLTLHPLITPFPTHIIPTLHTHRRSELVAAEKKHADLVAQDKANKAIARAPSSAQNTNGGAEGGVAVPLSPEEAAAAAQRDQLLGAEQRLKQATNPSTHIGEGLEGMYDGYCLGYCVVFAFCGVVQMSCVMQAPV